jgi:hypothetical protein
VRVERQRRITPGGVVGERVGDLLAGEAEVQRHEDRPGAGRAEEQLDELDPVLQRRRDAAAGRDPGLAQGAGDAGGVLPEDRKRSERPKIKQIEGRREVR